MSDLSEGWIDVHSHFTVPADRRALDLDPARDHMERMGIGAQLLSDLTVYDHEAVRRSNDYGAASVQGDPTRFGLLAALPLTEPEAALDEIDRVVREHQPEGFALCATYDGDFLGAERFRPVWRELSRRRATVLVHPNPFTPGALPLPPPLFEVAFDTARTAVSMLWAGTLQDAHDVKVIFTHAGGALPALAGRLDLLCDAEWVPHDGVHREGIRSTLAEVYYDTAMSASQGSLAPVLSVTSPDHILYGSDFGAPCADDAVLQRNLENLTSSPLLPEGVAASIGRNAQVLFPRLARRMSGR
ncbi:amidohydrolase family protein [Gordonia terrae]|uniref:amidohydrolase family protein n=1 Tax=Gordonia terrae TaxID=2055 RepID=UPI003F6A9FD0